MAGCQQAPDIAVATPAPAAPQPSPETAPPSKITPAHPQSVLGLQPQELERMLGAPKFVRRDAPAEVWQYRSDACVLDVFIYQAGTGALVKYAEARTVSAEPAVTDECVNAIRQQKSTDRLPT
ncbi:MAG TPA: hypothetical protein VH835_17310 [Dongiaceae bacterium]